MTTIPVRPLRVVLLTSDTTDDTMARALAGEPAVNLVGILAAPIPRARSWTRRLKNVYRYHGLAGVLGLPARIAMRVIRRALPAPTGERDGREGFSRQLLRSFHDEAGLATIRALAPDVIVVDGTYILPPSVFQLAKLATLNLHCGKLPEYKGAPPVFWELFHDEHEVGVTVHGVTAGVDAGPIFNQQLFPIPHVLSADPLEFVRSMWLEVLRPAGVALVARTIHEIAEGTARPRAQPPSGRPAFRRPDHRTAQRLRTVLRERGRWQR